MTPTLAGALAAVLASTGGYLIWSAATGRVERSRRGVGLTSVTAVRWGSRYHAWMAQAGLAGVRPRAFAASMAAAGLSGGLFSYVLFGGIGPALGVAAFAASFPLAAYRRRRIERMDRAAEAWPRILEEIRMRTGSLGRSIPQALLEAGRRAPQEWRGAFAAAEREWLLTTDFARTTTAFKATLADPTADAICETLLIAHEIGGTDLEPRLAELIDDRQLDLHNRKDAATKLAGVRFARRFVLVVPLGMALAGLAIGDGRQAYASTGGQIAVIVGVLATAVCWTWAGRLMRPPMPPRVFR